MASDRLCSYGRKLSFDDVLHHRRRLDARLCTQDGHRRVCRSFPRGSGKCIRQYAGSAGVYDSMDDCCCAHWLFCLQSWSAKWCRANHQSHDELFIYYSVGFVRAQCDSSWSRRRNLLLLDSQFPSYVGGRYRRSRLCRYGASILHIKLRNWRYVYFWQLYQQGPFPHRRNSKYLCAGYYCRLVGRTGHHSRLLCLRHRRWPGTGVSICNPA